VILSIVLAGAFSLSNKAIQTGQLSIERTEAVNIVRDYAETLRFIHTTDAAGFDSTWDDILDNASSSPPSYVGDEFCDVSVSNPKYFDFSEIGSDPTQVVEDFSITDDSNGRPQYADATDNEGDDLFAVWLEVYNPSTSGIVDIHIRACWDALGSDNVQRVGSVVRLSETRDI